MELRQFAITTTFLNALLHTELYMHQVPGYVDLLRKHLVSLLENLRVNVSATLTLRA